MKVFTLERLDTTHPCDDFRKKFINKFPKGVPITPEGLTKAEKIFGRDNVIGQSEIYLNNKIGWEKFKEFYEVTGGNGFNWKEKGEWFNYRKHLLEAFRKLR